MRKSISFITTLALVACINSVYAQKKTNTLSKKEKKDGWALLFDGVSAEHWRGVNKQIFPEKGWKIENGEMVSGNGGSIITQKEYGSFEFVWQWKMMDKGGNSGVKYLVKEVEKGALGIEFQILDDENHPWMKEGKMKPGDYHTMGSVYELYAITVEKKVNPLGEWNTGKIIVRDNQVEHWLNGVKLIEYDRGGEDFKERVAKSKFKDAKGFGLHKTGHIMLQDHGSIVHFRALKIREL